MFPAPRTCYTGTTRGAFFERQVWRIHFTVWLRSLPLLRKLTLLFMLLVLLPCLLLGVMLYRQNFDRRIKEAVDQNAAALRSMAADIRVQATQVETIVEHLSYNEKVRGMLVAPTLEKQILALIGDVTDFVQGSETYLQHLGADIVLICPADAFAERYGVAVRESRFAGDASYQSFVRGTEISSWGAPDAQAPSLAYQTGNAMLPYYRKVMVGLNGRAGVVRCGIQANLLFAPLFIWGDALLDDALALIVQRGDEIIHQIGDNSVAPLKETAATAQIESTVLYLAVPLESMGFTLVMALDYGLLRWQSLRASLPVMLAGLGLGFCMMLAARFLLRSMLARLQRTMHAISEIRVEERAPRLPDEGTDEVGRLVGAFNRLLSHIDENVEELLRKEQDKQQAHLMALQYQVNPHFLFNALYWLQMKAEEEGLEAVSEAVASLGVVLRYNLSPSNRASLGQEAVHMNAYIRFMRIRSNNRIELKAEWDDARNAVELLRFTFLPLVENAVHHGMLPDRTLHIGVAVEAKEGALWISVSNDGKEMDAETLERVQALFACLTPQAREGIGLSNLIQRLRMYYGAAVTMEASSANGLTRFDIRIPYEEAGAGREEGWHAVSGGR